ncbi:polymerase processivity factor [Elephant endotheliotropic herpesvirus 3B]|nr:polymerase processivity factor [Elephant endotheliotropic herpesvirus 3B]
MEMNQLEPGCSVTLRDGNGGIVAGMQTVQVNCAKLKALSKVMLKLIQENQTTITLHNTSLVVQRVKAFDSNVVFKLVFDDTLCAFLEDSVTINNALPLVGNLLELVVQHKTDSLLVSYPTDNTNYVNVKLLGGDCWAVVNTGRVNGQRIVDMRKEPLLASVTLSKSAIRQMVTFCKHGEKIPDVPEGTSASRRRRYNLKRELIMQLHGPARQVRLFWGLGESMLPALDVTITSGEQVLYFPTNLERFGEAVSACANMCAICSVNIYATDRHGEIVAVFSSRGDNFVLQAVVVSDTYNPVAAAAGVASCGPPQQGANFPSCSSYSVAHTAAATSAATCSSGPGGTVHHYPADASAVPSTSAGVMAYGNPVLLQNHHPHQRQLTIPAMLSFAYHGTLQPVNGGEPCGQEGVNGCEYAEENAEYDRPCKRQRRDDEY